MLRRLLDLQLSFFEKGKPLHRWRPLVAAADTFCYEPAINTKRAPFVRDAVDAKRWMIIVIFALLPAILMAIWNSGVQKFVYASGNYEIMNAYLLGSETWGGYFDFVFSDMRWLTILKLGALAFLPVMIISYAVGGLVEGIIACIRGHEIAEGFLVTGMLYPLVLPSTIPYWMVAFGVAAGVIIGKELFGGTGMNILNPALTARAFLFFTFPGKMTGDVWIGTNPVATAQSVKHMNEAAGLSAVDGYSQATALQSLNMASDEVKRIHVDAIATNTLGNKVGTYSTIETYFTKWKGVEGVDASLGSLTGDQLRSFVTGPMESGGLGLLPDNYSVASNAVDSIHGLGKFTDSNLFFGNIPGSMGETSTFAILLGALFLIWMGVGAWRTMVACGIGALIVAFLFQFFSSHTGIDAGAWNPARFSMPAYRQLFMGGLAFALVFMTTDPVSAPGLSSSKWLYGGMIGGITILIRLINPAFPEGVMLAVLFANVFGPLIDYYMLRSFRRARRVRAIA